MGRELAIVHVTRSPVGGIFRHIADLAAAQRQAGHRVGLVCDSTSGGAFENERLAALEQLLPLGIARIPMSRSIGPGDLPAMISVARKVAAMRPDVVHAHGAKGGLYGRLAAFAERRRGHATAAFYAPHGGSLHYDRTSLSGRLFFSVERALERLTDGLIHVSAYEAETYREKIGVPRCPAHVVLNGLRREEFEPVVPATDAADFLFIGELRDLKGVDVFIEALALLAGEGIEARALIVGGGLPEDIQRYRNAAERAGLGTSLVFRPPMPARAAFALGRTLVVPSRAESMPYLVLEATAAGVPIVATQVGGIPEILTGDCRRHLVPAGDAPALAAAMQARLDKPDAWPVLPPALVKQKFSLDSMAARVEAIYRSALERRYSVAEAGAVAEIDASR